MRILRTNFEVAIALAISTTTGRPAKQLPQRNEFESAFAAGLREVLLASERGETIEIVDKR